MNKKGWAAAVVRRRGVIALGWLGLTALLVPLAGELEQRLDVSARIEGSESAAVEETLATRFESPFARNAVVVLTGLPGPETREGREALGEVVQAIKAVPGVTRTFSHLDTSDRLFRAGGTFVVVGLQAGPPVDSLVPPLRAATGSVAARLRERFPAATLRVTGEPALNFDFRRAAATGARSAERRALPVTVALLLLAFGGIVASALPIVAGGLAIVLTLGAAALLTGVLPLSVTLESVVSMLGLGLGIDYGLLMVSRFRESREAGGDPEAAAEDAARHAGKTVILSGAAVAIGFLGLLAVPLGEIRSVAVGGLVVVAASVLLATTLLPGLLAWMGPRIDAGRWWAGRSSQGRGEGWMRWGRWVAAHPLLVLVVSSAPVLLLALEARRLTTDMPRGDWLPPSLESAAALHDLQAMGRRGLVAELRVILELPEDVQSLSVEGWRASERLAAVLAADPRVAEVRSLRTYAGDRADDLAYISVLPGFLKRSYLSGEGDAVLLEVLPREDVEAGALTHLVRELRAGDVARWSGVAGTRLRVGGLPAFNADYEDAVAGRFPGIVALVVGGTFLALLVGFRSVLVPIKAVVLNLLSVAAAFGAVVIVFQDGRGAAWLGLTAPTGGVFPAVPLLVFCIVFGLSMDYEVFLVARVAEARRAGRDEAEALAEGLARTGGVITSAAAIMIAVFGAFAVGDVLLVKMLGFALAVAVLIDATLIRVAIGPALLRLAGPWNWWPGGSHATGERGVLTRYRSGRGQPHAPAPAPCGPAGSGGTSGSRP
jgi:putative drug exporter of the RND superfamily